MAFSKTHREQLRTILTSNGEREVDASEFQKLVDRDAPVVSVAPTEGSAGVRLWDCIDNQWTQPLPADKVSNYLYHHNVLKCTACKFTSGTQDGIRDHVRTRLDNARLHVGEVEMVPFMQNGITGQTCSACGDTFTRTGQGPRHLAWWREQGPLHEGASLVLMARFALQQPVAEGIVRRIPAPAEGQQPVLEAPQASEEHRSRRRRRRRRRAGIKEVGA